MEVFFGSTACIGIGYFAANYHWGGWVLVAIGVLGLIGLFAPSTAHYCADCGQFFGSSPRVCGRCGCNRYTTVDPGVGRTFRVR